MKLIFIVKNTKSSTHNPLTAIEEQETPRQISRKILKFHSTIHTGSFYSRYI